jgi:hypothetical protein
VTKPPYRTGRGDPQGSSIQHGAGCAFTALLAVPNTIAAIWRHREELADVWKAEYQDLRAQEGP